MAVCQANPSGYFDGTAKTPLQFPQLSIRQEWLRWRSPSGPRGAAAYLAIFPPCYHGRWSMPTDRGSIG